MKKANGTIYLSASDLVGHLNCNHLSALDLQVASGSIEKPQHYDPLLEILQERGTLHEQEYISHLESQGYDIEVIEGDGIHDANVEQTIKAMESGREVIVQAALKHERWNGRADILRKVSKPSSLGDWSYEVIDTKLARETKGGSILQLCLYADLLSHIQGVEPEFLYIVTPWTDFQAQQYRYPEYAAYYRRVKESVETAVDESQTLDTYPDPKPHCEICRWRESCDKQRRDDDHLCLVANITKNQISELSEHGISTLQSLASQSSIPFQPQKGSPVSFEKTRAQAAIQAKGLKSGKCEIEFLDVIPNTGFSALPEPSPGDVFFDIESDQFVGEHGLEYLFGYVYFDENSQPIYIAEWAFNREEEKKAFERFVDFLTERKKQFPDLHVFHYAPYEPSALKRLMGRYASKEEEIDDFLRGKIFVDLLSVVKNSIRASVESYSLKKLEPFYEFDRKVSLHDANVALTALSACLELNDHESITKSTKECVQGYNADDCYSTLELRNWLETLRQKRIDEGLEIQRPAPGQEGASEELDEQTRLVRALIEKLTHDVPIDIDDRSEEQQARWILAHLLEWHRREDKAVWWEFFRLRDLTDDDLISEKSGLAHLTLIDEVDSTSTGIPVHRYRFAQQDTDVRETDTVKQAGGEALGTIIAINAEARTVDIKKSRATANIHPEAIFTHKIISGKEQAASLFRLGTYVAENGIEGDGSYQSARDLLLRNIPDLANQPFIKDSESTLNAAIRLTGVLNAGVLAIQGPPGTGKSHTGARMICELAHQGKKIGITANSHKVIRNLIDKVLEAADELDIDLHCMQKPSEIEPNLPRLSFVKSNDALFDGLSSGTAQVAGATHFLWSREEAINTLDVLVVDEAAQMSLANVVAIGQAAPALILLGDPQQLEQPMQGSHPDGTDVSAMDHILQEHQTISKNQGLFLPETWRLHPDICIFNSEQFYEGKLVNRDGCEQQRIISSSKFNGSGLRYVPASHSGNTSSSPEEAQIVSQIVNQILDSKSEWIDREGVQQQISLDDILIIAPYNAQVFEIQKLLPNARAGTVDKFQGQEAPITIYSMATSSYEEAPRGMEFLYSSNRLNVAISRAQCLSILVSEPKIFEAECKTPRQIQLANSHCRYIELAEIIEVEL